MEIRLLIFTKLSIYKYVMINNEKHKHFKYKYFNYKNINITVNCIKLMNLEN